MKIKLRIRTKPRIIIEYCDNDSGVNPIYINGKYVNDMWLYHQMQDVKKNNLESISLGEIVLYKDDLEIFKKRLGF